MFFFISAVLPPSAHTLDYAQEINPGWAARNSSLQHVVLCRTLRFCCRCQKTCFYCNSAGWEGWSMLLGSWQSAWQGVKGWEMKTVLWLRQLTATLESDLASKTESRWEGGTSLKPNVLQVVAICMFLLLWASDPRPPHVISGRFAQSQRKGQWEMSFQQIMRRSVVKSSPAFVFGADYSY